MANLKTSYLGLEMECPILVGASGLTMTPEGVGRAAEAGAGAVVLKSLFEEQIRLEFADTEAAITDDMDMHSEAYAYLEADLAARQGPRRYLELIRSASRAVSIPVIASVNCTGSETWVEFAEQIAAAGAAALEVNLYILPTDPEMPGAEIERAYLDAVEQVTASVKIPVAVKLAPYLTNAGWMAKEMASRGADGLVIFNRFYQPDIDLEAEEYRGGLVKTNPGDHRRILRWLALLSGRVSCDLCGVGGIHDGQTVAKAIMAGAQAVQAVSVFYERGVAHLAEMRAELEGFMDGKGYADLDAFRGKLSHERLGNAPRLERAQYIKAFVGIE